MDYNEFSEKIKAKYPQYANLDNKELAERMIAKYPQYKEQVTFDAQEEAKEPRLFDKMSNDDVKAYYQNELDKRKEWEQNHPFISSLQKDFSPTYRPSQKEMELRAKYGYNVPLGEEIKSGFSQFGQQLVPATNIAIAIGTGGIGAGAKGLLPIMKAGAQQGLIQGGVLGATHELGDNGLSLNVIPQTLGGATLGGTAGGLLPPVLIGGGKVLGVVGDVGKKFMGKLAQITPETVEQVVKPTSKALDYTRDKAQDVLRSTTERVRNAYNNLLGQKGEAITAAEENLRNIPNRINVDDVIGDITGTFDKYQGENINPARNMAGSLEENLIDLVNSARPITEIDTSVLPSGMMNKNEYNKAIRDLYNTNVKGKRIKHPKQGDIYMRRHGANETINKVGNDYEQLSLLPQIDEITEKSMFKGVEPVVEGKPNKIKAKNYDVYRGRAKLHGNDVDTEIKVANTDQGKMFYLNERPLGGESGFMPYGQPGDTLESINSINDVDAYFNSLSPIDLQKLKQQVGQMTNWQDTTRPKIQNTILEQVYGKLRNRLEDLSPELAQANKEYAALKGFQDDEGLKTILAPGGAIDRASTTLKNYNSTVSKGNTAKNIQALEDVLTEQGEAPFLNTMDDINAAMDLLKQEKTGLGSIAELGKSLITRPALKLARAYNRSNWPRRFTGLREGVQRAVIPLMYNAPRLYGGVVYDKEY